jgi:excisionase family DNA binding protein
MENLSTKQVCRRIGIARATLERWLAQHRIQGPKTVIFAGSKFRDWTARDSLKSAEDRDRRLGNSRFRIS